MSQAQSFVRWARSLDFAHAGERRPFSLDRAAGRDDARLGALPGRAANRLPRLAGRLCRHCASIDDDEVARAARQSRAPHRLGFDEVQPAAESEDFDGRVRGHAARSVNAAGSSRASNSNSTGPLIRTCPSSRHVIVSSPPGSATLARRPVWPARAPATRVAHAAEPQASVAPAPRSQTRSLMRSGAVTSARTH